MKNITLFLLFTFLITGLSAQTPSLNNDKMSKKILIHITEGPENPTKAALGFLVAKTALEEGHTVSLFLAGDAVKLLQDTVLNTLTGLGTGKLREHFDAIIKNKGRFYLSGNSSKARGVTEADLKDKSAEFALPTVLLRLSLESDRQFTY